MTKKEVGKQALIYGYHPVLEAIHSGKQIERIYIKNTLRRNTIGELMHLVKANEIPVQFVPTEKLNRLTRKNHQGIVAYLSSIEYQNIEQLIPSLYEQGKTPLIAVLDNITDVQNFGAIIRTLECAGIHGAIIPFKGSAQIGPDATKTSAGALHYLPICRTKNLQNAITFLKQSGLQVIAATEKSATLYDSLSYTSPTALIMGSEERGISPQILTLTDNQVQIPLYGNISSLNVSAATAILAYEAIRQRRNTNIT